MMTDSNQRVQEKKQKKKTRSILWVRNGEREQERRWKRRHVTPCDVM